MRRLGRRDTDKIPEKIAANTAKLMAQAALFARAIGALKSAMPILESVLEEEKDAPKYQKFWFDNVRELAREYSEILKLAKEKGLIP